MDFETWQHHMEMSNDTQYRYMMIFLRTPLFFPNPNFGEKNTPHWSPITGYLPEEDLVLVADVNNAYSYWTADSRRVFESTKTRSFLDGEWRGLIRINLTGKERSLVPADPEAKVFPEALVTSFLSTKTEYYECLSQSSVDGFLRSTRLQSLCCFDHDGSIPFFRMLSVPGIDIKIPKLKDVVAEIELIVKTQSHALFCKLPSLLPNPTKEIILKAFSKTGFMQVTKNGTPNSSVMAMELTDFDTNITFPERAVGKVDIFEMGVDRNDPSLWPGIVACIAQAFKMFKYFGTTQQITDDLLHVLHEKLPIGPGQLIRVLVATDAEDDLKVVGTVVVASSKNPEAEAGSFFMLSVLPCTRGLGVGSYLTSFAMKLLKETGHRFVVIEATPEGKPVYKKLGFFSLPSTDAVVNISKGRLVPLWIKFIAWPLEKYVSRFGFSLFPLLRFVLFV
eukprot:CAMPEP_0174266204 /NCGR_PEP_ID=MMETSP0439-20130205/29370_1 /TAXON_ID=0 /ORGANISM="Stereomyxa ramosa, Strain Chinc5" /LENGTH=448 /DNA_ID=CAMNT_0015353029 /DNA_START=546 /DNA_END=1889 /DNA_ORIENTATION=-